MDRREKFMDRDAIRDEMREFREEYNKERKNFGEFVPAHRLYNTGFVLYFLLKIGKIDSNGVGYKPMR